MQLYSITLPRKRRKEETHSWKSARQISKSFQNSLEDLAANIKSWLKAFRLRTLPLSFSCIAMGSFLAASENKFNAAIFSLCIVTTLFLQILSNLANDYGDTVHGADSSARVGPQRTVQSGEITPAAMKSAMFIFGALAFISGIILLYLSFGNLLSRTFFVFLLLGLGAIAAAIKYTAGKNPYGYKGFGDFFVFLFFGLVGVGGTYYLFTHHFNSQIILPASSIGLLCAGVLNVNNMRDRISDAAAGKITIAVRLDERNVKYYHLALVTTAWFLILVYTALNFQSASQFIFLISFPLFVIHLFRVFKNKEAALLDGQLKVLVLSTLFYCITFGIGLLLP